MSNEGAQVDLSGRAVQRSSAGEDENLRTSPIAGEGVAMGAKEVCRGDTAGASTSKKRALPLESEDEGCYRYNVNFVAEFSEGGVVESDHEQGTGRQSGYGMEGEGNSATGGIGEDVGEGDPAFHLGIEVKSLKEAYCRYVEFAYRHGFGVRKGHSLRVEGSTVIKIREYVCSKNGVYERKNGSIPAKGKKLVNWRTNCKAKCKFRLTESGNYRLWKLDNTHNHILVPPGLTHHIRCHRNIPAATAPVMDGMTNARITPCESFGLVNETSGGYGSVGLTMDDHYNNISSMRERVHRPGDCQAMLNHFSLRSCQDPLFYSAYEVDNQSRLTNVFWRDGASLENYHNFGDVVVFDTTFKTCGYDMVFAPFVGVNNHFKNVYFGCAYLLDESVESFTWLFERFLECMGGAAPRTLFTDQDPAMEAAIRKVFPDTTQHRLCIWHIARNANQYLATVYRQKGFKAAFNRMLHDLENPDEFDKAWSELFTNFNVSEKESSWLMRLHSKREKWSSGFGRDIFSADIHSTQRSESANNTFKNIAESTMPLSEFIVWFETNAEMLREAERKDNFKCYTGEPNVFVPGPILAHAACLYTHAIFDKFQSEVLKSCADHVVAQDEVEDGKRYHVRSAWGNKINYVTVGKSCTTIQCSCKRLEFAGWFCGHVWRVMEYIQWTRIPDKYIQRRWTKDIRMSDSLCVPLASSWLDKRDGNMVNKFIQLVHRSNQVMNMCAEHETTYMKALQVLQELNGYCKDFRTANNVVDVHQINESSSSEAREDNVRDPFSAR